MVKCIKDPENDLVESSCENSQGCGNWMKVFDTEIEGVKIIEPDVFGDERGWFCETYNAERYRKVGIENLFVQDNESFSSKGVVRGLHWQAAPHTQAKLVRVIQGAVWDVAVDIRKGSPTFGKHVAMVLSGKDRRQFYIPRGFAHGFIVLEDNTLFRASCKTPRPRKVTVCFRCWEKRSLGVPEVF